MSDEEAAKGAPFMRAMEKRASGALLLLPFAAGLIVYARFLGQWFFRDDIVWLGAASNPDLADSLRGAFTLPDGPTPYWRPLTDFYFFAMYRVFALESFPYHLANVLLHSMTAAITAALICRVTRSLSTGLLAGLLFAIAQAYGTGIVWVSTVGMLMATLLILGTMVLFLRHLVGCGGGQC